MRRAGPSPRVLALFSHYLPGYRAGGPVRSIANLVSALGTELSFFVITLAWDLGTRDRYEFKPGLRCRRVGFARVLGPEGS